MLDTAEFILAFIFGAEKKKKPQSLKKKTLKGEKIITVMGNKAFLQCQKRVGPCVGEE